MKRTCFMAAWHLYLSKLVLFFILFAGACTYPQKGQLPVADPPQSLISTELKPSLSVKIVFLPPPADEQQRLMEQQLIQELTEELDKTRYFKSIMLSSDSSDIRMSIVLTQAISTTSNQFGLYLATGGLAPVKVPVLYELQAEIQTGPDKTVKYEIKDKASKLVMAPAWPPVDWSIDTTSQSIRRNLYKTLMLRMHADGLIKSYSDDEPR